MQVVGTNMNYFQHLKLPFEFDLSNIAKFDVETSTFNYKILDKTLVDKRIINLLEMHGLFVLNVDIFYTPPGGVLRPHIDLDKLSNFCKINFCYGAHGSRMYWYTLQNGYTLQLDLNNNGYYAPTPGTVATHILIPRQMCVSAASTMIGTPTLVNVGQPHGVINYSKEGRWCLCITCVNKQGCIVEFDEARDKLKEYIV
jgi:hypothetical protein